MLSANRAPILLQDKHYLQMDQNELPLEPCHLGVPSGVSKTISEAMVRSCKPCTYLASRLHYLQMDQNELPLDPRHLGVPSAASKTISEPWYVWRKPCTDLAPTITLSPNGPKRDST